MTILVTGGAGFIGSNFIINWFQSSKEKIVNLDKLTYAGNLDNLINLNLDNSSYEFIRGDISDAEHINFILNKHDIRGIINFAAESHVDKSIINPKSFILSNVLGVSSLLTEFTSHWQKNYKSSERFIFLHISTDEVYGDLLPNDSSFKESNRYLPNNPYSASKAASDHLVRAFHMTYGLPVITTNCSNNYGPRQFHEKLIPMIISCALNNENIQIYGDGSNIRDWLYVNDHCDALKLILENGVIGENYNIGGDSEKNNIHVAESVCKVLDKLMPKSNGHSYKEQICFTIDRPGHDKRYSINCQKIKNDLGWSQIETFESGLFKTVKWYLDNPVWLK